jgi:hypothetical protein
VRAVTYSLPSLFLLLVYAGPEKDSVYF